MIIQKFLKMLMMICCIGSIGYSSCNPHANHEEQSLPKLLFASELQEAINQVLAAYSDYKLGISAAVIVPGYETWTGVSGNSHDGVPVTTDMLFDVGSIEKNFQAALILKLVEDGPLSLDDPISKYLPRLHNVDGAITVRQLLNHTSGVFNVFEHPEFPWVGAGVDYSKEWGLEQVFNTFVLEPYGPPGYAQHYSSTNYLLLTAITAEVTGSTVPDEIGRYFIKPMNLEHTYISMGQPPPARYAVAHPWADIDRNGELDDLYGIPLVWKVTLTHPVMFSTPADLVRWSQALYEQGIVLPPDSLAEMLTYPETILRDPDGGVYGLGVVDYTDILGIQVVGHAGSSLGYSAAALYLPEYRSSVAWMINTGESPYELAGQMMSATWDALSDVLRKHGEMSP
jgi:CubicO group peptidase (beta-lactamase class C family)